MNWVLILVIAILAGYTIAGYTKGFLKILYSLVSWILMMVVVVVATPYIEGYLHNETGIYEKIVSYSEEKLREQASEQIEEEGTGAMSSAIAENEMLAVLMEKLPQETLDALFAQAEDMAGGLMESYDIYGKAAVAMAELLIKGIAFVLALLAGSVLSLVIVKIIDIIGKLPLIGFANSILGLGAGAANGLLVVWAAFYLVATWSATEFCSKVISYIYMNEFLTVLYEKNLILSILMK